MNAKRVLVTGADGFIGSHLTEELVRRGYKVRAFTLYNSFGSRGWLHALEHNVLSSIEDIFAGDIRDPYGVRKAVSGCDIVFHLAALIAIPYSYHSPQTYVETNINGTLNILQASRDLNVGKIVHTSTSEVYGTATFVPITEDHPLNAQSPYAATKIAADQLALSFHRSFDTPVAVVRPFNTYGPRQSTRAIIPTIITQINIGQRQLRLGSLHPTRDFNYVSDTVRGFIAVADAQASVGEVINIGSNFEVSIGETVELIASNMSAEVDILTDEQRLRPRGSEVERLWADNAKARRLIGWEPLYGGRDGFERGLRETIAWFSEPENLKSYNLSGYIL